MLVVVYLITAKKNIIIPQNWIMGLNQETLNNIGKASYQNRRIFWSEHGFNDVGLPNASIEPNFRLPLSNTFPPNIAETCYIARVKRYCGECCIKEIFQYWFFSNSNLAE